MSTRCIITDEHFLCPSEPLTFTMPGLLNVKVSAVVIKGCMDKMQTRTGGLADLDWQTRLNINTRSRLVKNIYDVPGTLGDMYSKRNSHQKGVKVLLTT